MFYDTTAAIARTFASDNGAHITQTAAIRLCTQNVGPIEWVSMCWYCVCYILNNITLVCYRLVCRHREFNAIVEYDYATPTCRTRITGSNSLGTHIPDESHKLQRSHSSFTCEMWHIIQHELNVPECRRPKPHAMPIAPSATGLNRSRIVSLNGFCRRGHCQYRRACACCLPPTISNVALPRVCSMLTHRLFEWWDHSVAHNIHSNSRRLIRRCCWTVYNKFALDFARSVQGTALHSQRCWFKI